MVEVQILESVEAELGDTRKTLEEFFEEAVGISDFFTVMHDPNKFKQATDWLTAEIKKAAETGDIERLGTLTQYQLALVDLKRLVDSRVTTTVDTMKTRIESTIKNEVEKIQSVLPENARVIIEKNAFYIKLGGIRTERVSKGKGFITIIKKPSGKQRGRKGVFKGFTGKEAAKVLIKLIGNDAPPKVKTFKKLMQTYLEKPGVNIPREIESRLKELSDYFDKKGYEFKFERRT